MVSEIKLLFCADSTYLRQDWIEHFISCLNHNIRPLCVVVSQNRGMDLFFADKCMEYGIKTQLIATPRYLHDNEFMEALITRNKRIAEECSFGIAFWSGAEKEQNPRGLLQYMGQAGKPCVVIPGTSPSKAAMRLMDTIINLMDQT